MATAHPGGSGKRAVKRSSVGLVFSMPSQKIGLGNVSKMTYFVLSGMQNLNSINQSNKQYQSIKMLVKFF